MKYLSMTPLRRGTTALLIRSNDTRANGHKNKCTHSMMIKQIPVLSFMFSSYEGLSTSEKVI